MSTWRWTWCTPFMSLFRRRGCMFGPATREVYRRRWLAEVTDWMWCNWGVITTWRRLGLSWNKTLLPPTVSSITVPLMKISQLKGLFTCSIKWCLFLFDQTLYVEILRGMFDLSGKVAHLISHCLCHLSMLNTTAIAVLMLHWRVPWCTYLATD